MAFIQKIKQNRKQKGYTIVEVMIVLTVSTALFATAVAGYSRQNQRTEFTNAVRDVETTIQDILNDVSTGYYPNSSSFSCSRSALTGAIPSLNPSGTADQGTNQECTFLGKAVNLRDADAGSFFTSYTIVGLRNSSNDGDKLPTDVEDAENRIVAFEGTFARHNIRGSIDIPKVVSLPSPTASSGFAVISGFGHGDIGGAGATTTQVLMASISEGYIFVPDGDMVVSTAELDRDIIICINEAGGGRRASITIGVGSQTNIETTIDNWPGECNS